MTSQILSDLIQNVNQKNLIRFFREKTSLFQNVEEGLSAYESDQFTQGVKLGDIPFGSARHLIVCSFNVTRELSERSGKKAQYDLAKKIISDRGDDAGIFIFAGETGNFRFSLIYANYVGTKPNYNNFRRFTYFVSPELTNKTFIQRIGGGDFSSLESIKEAFSVEKVTKEFFQQISYWYFWACQKCQFPKDAEEQENGRQIAVIRLITRMIFIWFMREMNLIPNYLFNQSYINNILTDIAPPSSTYYLAILQNLFFATLNTRQSEREFRSQVKGHKGYNPDFGNQYKFRYQEFFAEPEKLKEYFEDIPFLNGGLFDCLDEKSKDIYIDGFTATKKHQPDIPNELFFSDERSADLNTEFGTSNRTYRVEGLINILSTYNFTIDENTIDDKDVALDPELLGKVFENLLASFNPETSSTARKATGSYYTPREIVEYMVEESLKGYFLTHITDVDQIEKKLSTLFEPNSEKNPFTLEETKRIVTLIDNVRIVDPAVGSGAFPMGALNKLVFILSKLDKNNALWKQAQLEAADLITDPSVRSRVKESIQSYFQEKNADYGRKLYLIQKCIYGVDIQQIAVEIAKLRFFIALLVDETIDTTKDNWGIEPLPNLDLKIMPGNSLISEYFGIKFTVSKENLNNNGNLRLFDDNKTKLIEILEQKKIAYQTESDHQQKRILREEIDDLLARFFKSLVREQKSRNFQRLSAIEKKYSIIKDEEVRKKAIGEEKQKLASSTGFDFDTVEDQLRQFTSRQGVKPFFPWELYFSEVFLDKDGFDIVVGNPPYIDSEGMVNLGQSSLRDYIVENFHYTKGNWDIYIAFFEKGLNLLNSSGHLIFITPDKWVSKSFGNEFRKNTYKNIVSIFQAGREIFENSIVDSIITLFSMQQVSNLRIYKFEENKIKLYKVINKNILESPFALDPLFSSQLDFIMKLDELPLRISDLAECENACATSDAYKLKSLITNLESEGKFQSKYLKIINTGTIDKYISKWGKRKMVYLGNRYLYPVALKEQFLNMFQRSYGVKATKKKIIIKGLTLLDACLDDKGDIIPGKSTLIICHENISILKFLLGIINSKLAIFYIKQKYSSSSYNTGINFTKNMINNFPLPNYSSIEYQQIINIVESLTNSMLHDNKDKFEELEYTLNSHINKLYNLTENEIRIISEEN